MGWLTIDNLISITTYSVFTRMHMIKFESVSPILFRGGVLKKRCILLFIGYCPEVPE